MLAYFVVFMVINVFVAYFMFKQGFVVRSNSSKGYKIYFLLMLLVIIGAIILSRINIDYACYLAGLPAGATLAGIVAIGIALFFQKGPWR